MARRRHHAAASKANARNESVGSLIRFFLIVAVIAWAFRSLVGAPFSIPSGSMLPTLYIGDYLAVAKWPYGYSRYSFPLGLPAFNGRIFAHMPQRGDVVVFRHPAEDVDLIKRVIALPGDRIAVRNGRLILNGRPVPRRPLPPASVAVTPNSPCRTVQAPFPNASPVHRATACVYRAFLETLPGGTSYTVLDQVENGPADNIAETRIMPGHLFLMGDNRDDSLDSRFPVSTGGIGMVPVDHLIGRALVTFWSTDGGAYWFKPWTWLPALRAERIGNRYTGAAK